MEKNLLQALRKMSEADYRQLSLHLQTADMCRGIMREYELTDRQMAEHLNLTSAKFKQFKMGAYEYSIRDWAIMQALQIKLGTQRLLEKVNGQVQFPQYKYSQSPTP